MILLLSQAISGFLSSGLGVYFVSIYLGGADGATPLFLVLAVIFIAFGLGLLGFTAFKFFVKKKPETDTLGIVATPESESVLKRNNDLVNQWSKTTEARDRLKVLQVSAEAEEG